MGTGEKKLLEEQAEKSEPIGPAQHPSIQVPVSFPLTQDSTSPPYTDPCRLSGGSHAIVPTSRSGYNRIQCTPQFSCPQFIRIEAG